MELNYIVEICVAMDIAIVGIAYPMIVDKISNIGDQYSSEYLYEVFENRFPQKPLKITFLKKEFAISLFKLIIYFTLGSFIFLIVQAKPCFGWDNWFINNSAKLIVLAFTVLLTCSFFKWLNTVALFNGKSTTFLKWLINSYAKIKNDTELKLYHHKSINEITLYAVAKQDEHLQKTLLDFHSLEFLKIRNDQEPGKPLVYPIDFYYLVNSLVVELANNDNHKLRALEHRAVSGVWLLGEGFDHVIISSQTYQWIWRNLYTICDKGGFVNMYWANVSQYFNNHLEQVHQKHDEHFKTTNQVEIQVRIKERKTFMELHYALGGLLLYRGQHESLLYILQFSQSMPPTYPLLPYDMTEVFIWFEHFYNEFEYDDIPIDSKYYFPGLDNLGNQRQINYWICSYICLLYVWQFSRVPYLMYQDFTASPALPDNIYKLENLLNTIGAFERYLSALLENEQLFKEVRLDQTILQHRAKFFPFFTHLKKAVEDKIGQQKRNAPLSPDKVQQFNNASNKIIKDAFASYAAILSTELISKDAIDRRIEIKGGHTIMTKSAFTDTGTPHMNFDSIFAEQIRHNIIFLSIPLAFLNAATRRYLLNQENIIAGIDKSIGGNDAIIVGVNIDYPFSEILKTSKHAGKIRNVISTQPFFNNSLFILQAKDLPSIQYEKLTDEDIKKFNLLEIDQQMHLYTSVIDLTLPVNSQIKNEFLTPEDAQDNELKVFVAIRFLAALYFRKDRNIIQINLASAFKEQGMQNNLNDVQHL